MTDNITQLPRDQETVQWDDIPTVSGSSSTTIWVGTSSAGQGFTPYELHRAEPDLERWKRHTDDLAPQHTESDLLAFEKVWRRLKVTLWVLAGLVLVYIVVRVFHS